MVRSFLPFLPESGKKFGIKSLHLLVKFVSSPKKETKKKKEAKRIQNSYRWFVHSCVFFPNLRKTEMSNITYCLLLVNENSFKVGGVIISTDTSSLNGFASHLSR